MPDQVLTLADECPSVLLIDSGDTVIRTYPRSTPTAELRVEVTFKAGLSPGDPVTLWFNRQPNQPYLVETTDWQGLSDIQSNTYPPIYNFTGTPPRVEYFPGNPLSNAGVAFYPVTATEDGGYTVLSDTSGVIASDLTVIVEHLSMEWLSSAESYEDGQFQGEPTYRYRESWETYTISINRNLTWYYGTPDGEPLGDAFTEVVFFEGETETLKITIPGDARPLEIECSEGCEEDCIPIYDSRSNYLCVCKDNQPNDVDGYDYQPYSHNQTNPRLIDLNP
jgi:hypothetical protein